MSVPSGVNVAALCFFATIVVVHIRKQKIILGLGMGRSFCLRSQDTQFPFLQEDLDKALCFKD